MKNPPVDNRALLMALANCIANCDYCSDACLDEDDIKMMVPCIRLDRDCADICRLFSAYLSRRSPHAKHIVSECIEICQKCHDECAKHEHEHCQQCAKACQECLDACKAYQAQG